MAYAENTDVAVEKSVAEIVGLIKRAGANRIAQVEEPGTLAFQFFLNDRMLRFRVSLPSPADIPQYNPNNHQSRTNDQRIRLAQQRQRQRARALLLVIKAKLESVESGVETFDEAFLPNIVTPEGETVGDWLIPQIADAYLTGRVPTRLLPAPEAVDAG